MGKTTTIGKLAHRLRTEGNQTVLMAACDTFRAGAVEQLQQWADRAEVDMVGPTEKAKTPSAVLYSALDKAVAEKYNTVLVDTSGRLSNNEALTAELAKMKRVIQKRLSNEKDEEGKPIMNQSVPHETLLVLDAAQGRMALDSARVWNQDIGLTGLILTKLDGSARGGSVVAVSRDLKLPVKLIGVGEGIDDLRDVSRTCCVCRVKRSFCESMSSDYALLSLYSLNPIASSKDCWESVLQEVGPHLVGAKVPCWRLGWLLCAKSVTSEPRSSKRQRHRSLWKIANR
jgi:signal recognition particle GTPase